MNLFIERIPSPVRAILVRPWRILELFHEMGEKQLQLDPTHFNELLRAYTKSKDYDKAWEVFYVMMSNTSNSKIETDRRIVNIARSLSGDPGICIDSMITAQYGSLKNKNIRDKIFHANREENIFNVYMKRSRHHEMTYRLGMDLSIKTENYKMGMLLHKTMTVRGHRCVPRVLARLLQEIADARLRGDYEDLDEDEDDTDDLDLTFDSGYDFSNRNKVVVVDVDVGVDAARTSVLTAIRSQKRKVNSGGVFNDLLIVIGTMSMSNEKIVAQESGTRDIGEVSGESDSDSNSSNDHVSIGSGDEYMRPNDKSLLSQRPDKTIVGFRDPPMIRQSLYKLLREELQLEVISTSSASVLSSNDSVNMPRPVEQLIRDMVIFEILIVKKAVLINRFKNK